MSDLIDKMGWLSQSMKMISMSAHNLFQKRNQHSDPCRVNETKTEKQVSFSSTLRSNKQSEYRMSDGGSEQKLCKNNDEEEKSGGWNLAKTSNTEHSRNISVPCDMQFYRGDMKDITRRKKCRSKSVGLTHRIYGQKNEGQTVITMHGKHGFGHQDIFNQPFDVEFETDDSNSSVKSQQSPGACQEANSKKKSRVQNLPPPYPKTSTNNSNNSNNNSDEDRDFETTLNKQSTKKHFTEEEKKKDKKMDAFEIDAALETDVIMDTARLAFQRTVKCDFSKSSKTPQHSNSDSLDAFGGSQKSEQTVVFSTTPKSRELQLENHSHEKSPAINSPSLGDRNSSSLASGLSPRKNCNEKVFDSGQNVKCFTGKKTRKITSPKKNKEAKGHDKRSPRFRFLLECFGGRGNKEHEATVCRAHNNDTDEMILPSRRLPNGREGYTHRYTRRQAFIRTMIESHLEHHCT